MACASTRGRVSLHLGRMRSVVVFLDYLWMICQIVISSGKTDMFNKEIVLCLIGRILFIEINVPCSTCNNFFLRSYILSQQDRIMDATLVSMVGNSNSTTLDDYVQVLR